jgi:hypothetical protein
VLKESAVLALYCNYLEIFLCWFRAVAHRWQNWNMISDLHIATRSCNIVLTNIRIKSVTFMIYLIMPG